MSTDTDIGWALKIWFGIFESSKGSGYLVA